MGTGDGRGGVKVHPQLVKIQLRLQREREKERDRDCQKGLKRSRSTSMHVFDTEFSATLKTVHSKEAF